MESLLVTLQLPRGATARRNGAQRLTGVVAGTRTVEETSDEAQSQDGGSTPSPPVDGPTTKRKTTYYARKARALACGWLQSELEELQAEAATLGQRLTKLEDGLLRRQRPLLNALSTNAALQSHTRDARLAIARLHSLINVTASETQSTPIGCHIHLPRDVAIRRQIIEGMRQQKLQEAAEFLVNRCLYLDLRRPFRQTETFVTPSGDHALLHWELMQFDTGALTVEHVHEAMIYFIRTQEMAIAEKTGMLSVRESDTSDDDLAATQLRTVATHGELTLEKNLIVFSEYLPSSAVLSQPYGLFVVDSVDQDDLYPYQPETRVRKDVISAKMIVECPRSSLDEPPAVALMQWAYMKVSNSPLASREVLAGISHDAVKIYFSSMTKVIRDRLAWRQTLG